eukprot:CAMPEP_0178920324 /NCGR_PEP_ID=MMETSP0786-20121207/14943_1 /TAXON_ID=186022 /ORGANISM="Thalassionema frauenfeldii, Strain CCMP 1798" /LENGTH=376 /DNA_ID=CAMNT_0020594381 /DNA_START=1 /DNA_END=1131 /DNA_ORIENTATION=-
MMVGLRFIIYLSVFICLDSIHASTTSENAGATCQDKRSSSQNRIQTILQDAGFASKDIDTILDGKLHKKILDSTNPREIGMAFAVLLSDTSPDDISEAFISQRFKTAVDPAITGIGVINSLQSNKKKDLLEDFRKLSLFRSDKKKDESTVGSLLESSPSDDMNLSRDEINAFHKLKNVHDQSDSKTIMKKIDETIQESLLKRYQSYREKSLEGILPYSRSKGDYHPGKDMGLSSKMASVLRREAPIFFSHMSNFPRNRPDNCKESFSWVSFDVGNGIPNVELIHRMGRKQPETGSFVFMERHFFALHSYNSVHGEGGAIPCGDDRTLLIFSSRTSTDAVSGFGGAAKRSVGVRMMGTMVSDVLEKFKTIHTREKSK